VSKNKTPSNSVVPSSADIQEKICVEVIVHHLMDGSLLPLCIIWADGRRFSIDKVLDIRAAAAMKVGGKGVRYTCRVRNNPLYLFNDQFIWFIERP
jgi:hypothetical protein